MRIYTIWICPECGYYDADPILRRPSNALPLHCFRCGQEAVKSVDWSRVNSSWHHARKAELRDQAPLMQATRMIRLEDARANY